MSCNTGVAHGSLGLSNSIVDLIIPFTNKLSDSISLISKLSKTSCHN